MKRSVNSGVLTIALVSLLGSSAWAGDYGYNGHNSYGGGYGYNHSDYGYQKKKYYKKRKVDQKKSYKDTGYKKKYDKKKTGYKTRGFVSSAGNTSLPHLTDKKGMTLYVFDRDKYGVSNCYSDCALVWPPYEYKRGGKAKENYSVVVRKDGGRQWAYKGKPLYYWAGDQKPGELRGNGVDGVWHVLRSKEFKSVEAITANLKKSAEPAAQQNKPGLLTDDKKMTLYIFDKDKEGISNCYEDCAVSWPPYLADEKSQPKENFSIVVRKDGAQQWAYKGKPLYYWAGDQKPGDVTGDGVGGVWHVIKL